MLSREENELITRVGPNAPMGQAIRRYWIPALLSEELPGNDCDPLRVRLLGEDLVAFRDSNGQVGLLAANCCHRGASLFFGRNEECGLRCVYHGWKFDVTGTCVDMPNEPAESNFKGKVRQPAYPCYEKAGIVWTYMGPAVKQPPVPDYEWMRAAEGYGYVDKTFEDCNFVQCIEGGVDTSHSSFLHRIMDPNQYVSADQSYRMKSTAPRLEVLNTDYGYTYAGIRPLPEANQNYIRMYHFVMPFQQMRASSGGRNGGNRPTLNGHLWVPIDDEHTYVYNWFCARDNAGDPYTPEQIEAIEHANGRGKQDMVAGYKLIKNMSNDYLMDRSRMAARTSWCGIDGVNTQDFAVQESMGPIYDRSTEHLGTADTAVIAMRKLLLDAARAIQNGQEPLGADGGSSATARPAEGVFAADLDWTKAFDKELVPVW